MTDSHERSLVDKMVKLTNTQQSIQSLSLWIIYHKRRAESSVSVWKREILAAPVNRKLVYLYLANDVLQNAKKDTTLFEDAFSNVIVDVVSEIYPAMISKDQKSTSRMIGIWSDRKVFASDIIESLQQAITSSSGAAAAASRSSSKQKVRTATTITSDNSTAASMRKLDAISNSTSSSNNNNMTQISNNDKLSMIMNDDHPSMTSINNNNNSGNINNQMMENASKLTPTFAELSNRPIFKLLQAMTEIECENENNRCTMRQNPILQSEYKSAMLPAESGESMLEMRDISELQQWQMVYDGVLKQFSDVKNAFSKENSIRKKYISALKQELDRQQKLLGEYDQVVRDWTRNVADIQRFQTSIEICLTNKKMLQSDTLVSDYFSADQHQIQNTLAGKKRSLSDMSAPTINDIQSSTITDSIPFPDDDTGAPFKRPKLIPVVPLPDDNDLYVPEDVSAQDVDSVLDALEPDRNSASTLDTDDFLGPTFLSDADPFADDNNM